VIYQSGSPDQTLQIAADFARTLNPNTCLALHGDLGSGKTLFTRGLVQGLGGNPRNVSSPTFVLLNIYPTPKTKIFHLDAYRVHGPSYFDSIGFPELLEQNALVIIEWPDRITPLLPPNCTHIRFEVTGPNSRQITIDQALPKAPDVHPGL